MKTELTEIRNQLYDSLPTGDIASAYDIICRVNDHLKRLDAFIYKLPQADVRQSLPTELADILKCLMMYTSDGDSVQDAKYLEVIQTDVVMFFKKRNGGNVA